MLTKTSYKMKPPVSARIVRGHILGDLVGCWLMNEGSGNKVFDLSGSRNHGIFVGNLTWVAGKFGLAIDYPGSDSYINFGSNENLDVGTSNFTIIAYGNSDDFTKLQDILATRGSNPYEGYEFQIVGTGSRLKAIISDGVNAGVVTGAATLSQGIDYHMALTINRSTGEGKLYVDGLQSGSTADISAVTGSISKGETWSGERPIKARDFYGKLDYILLYNNRALSASEVALIHREPFCMFERRGRPGLCMVPAVVAVRRRSHVGFRPVDGADRLRGLRRNALY